MTAAIAVVLGTLCALVAVGTAVLALAIVRTAWIRGRTERGLGRRGFSRLDDRGGGLWFAGAVGGRPVAIGSVVVETSRRTGRRARRVQRRTRLVVGLPRPIGGHLYRPAGRQTPSVEAGRVPAREVLLGASPEVGAALWPAAEVRPAELPTAFLAGAPTVLWFDLRGVHTGGDELVRHAEALVRLAEVVDAMG